ncbi:MAG: hypothetical protein R3B93_21095 [Bacteroidia bacterium]
MKKLLITNLGNRNLLLEGKTHFAMIKEQSLAFNFRDFTKDLIDRFEEVKPRLQVNILDTLLEAKSSEIDRVIMFSSNHPSDQRRDQDTCYEGEILVKLLSEQFP